jgi:hypothetical protein
MMQIHRWVTGGDPDHTRGVHVEMTAFDMRFPGRHEGFAP